MCGYHYKSDTIEICFSPPGHVYQLYVSCYISSCNIYTNFANSGNVVAQSAPTFHVCVILISIHFLECQYELYSLRSYRFAGRINYATLGPRDVTMKALCYVAGPLCMGWAVCPQHARSVPQSPHLATDARCAAGRLDLASVA